jgi:hypothetical protein
MISSSSNNLLSPELKSGSSNVINNGEKLLDEAKTSQNFSTFEISSGVLHLFIDLETIEN